MATTEREIKKSFVGFMITKTDHDLLKEIAAKRDCSVSKVIRDLIRAGMRIPHQHSGDAA